MNNRERFLRACRCDAVDRPPMWLMRQAGRVLPEYRALREKYSFLELVQTPELATEVTLQPIRRFGFDAAILFSDILVIPEAVGQGYRFRDGGGVGMSFSVRARAEAAQLRWQGVSERLAYVSEALRLLRRELGGQTALIGFGGSPWTLANFMAEGGSTPEFRQAREWFEREPEGFEFFLERLAEASIEYYRMQIEAGIDVLQIFDSLGHLLPAELYERCSARWMAAIVQALPRTVPIVVFGRVPLSHLPNLLSTRGQIVGIDYTVDLRQARTLVPDTVAIQGNLDPSALLRSEAEVEASVKRVLEEMRGRRGYIFNLGHGLLPSTPVENVGRLVECVRNCSWQN